ncbi:malonyl-ACP O-methyltransferase BioC [Methylococcus sp. EFPC2]|uniref:malonyl-ACP O-methyltransferase BioC n=1 Tax=Methylococcus sp. EFPC2 TaxID=2812648 RepID=UPI001967E4CB|nr:malonyl-ACP O-methyltransferase BioC [Methylococcus sp. EFPC2]QSA98771.1 malonyl-ACP O-methyltransferase BioC [Methylococcus sp. EFPC2]
MIDSPGLRQTLGELDKRQVGRSFSRAARGYDNAAELQRRVGDGLICGLSGSRDLSVVVDIGAGTGYCTAHLHELFPGVRLIALDIAEGMLRKALEHPQLKEGCTPLCADAEYLPLRDASADLVISNLALQWCSNLTGVLKEFHRVLKPGGRLRFTTFGAQTLQELRAAWASVDAYSHVNEFRSRAEVERCLLDAGFSGAVVSSEGRRVEYAGVGHLMRELKELGAHNLTANRPRRLTGKQRFQGMVEAYETLTGCQRIWATFEIVMADTMRTAPKE